MDTKKIFLIIGLVAVLGLVLSFGFDYATDLSPTATTTPEGSDSIVPGGLDFELPEQILPLSNNPKDIVWAVFQKYLIYNKNRDLSGVKSVVYKIAPICEEPKDRIDCEARMASAYSYGSVLKKEDFKNVWEDEKQIILATDFKLEEGEDIMSRTRAIIFFIRDGAGFKMLSFSPNKGATVSKGTATSEELNDRLIIYTEDKDNDGRTDYEEECLHKINDSSCVKTSPEIRDSDGDGLWDGVEALIK